MKSLLNTLGGEAPQPNDNVQKSQPPKRKDSILDTVNTGFGSSNLLVKDCQVPKFKQILYKEDYLSVFTTETEKELARNNLGVVGVTEVTKLVKDLVKKDIESFITTEKVEEMIKGLDFVDSKLNSRVDYQIPDKLFKL